METGPAPAQKQLPASTATAQAAVDQKLERTRERAVIELRRAVITEWRFDEGLTLQQIADRLRDQYPDVPGMHVTISTLARDIEHSRRTIQKQWKKEFNPVAEFTRLIDRYERLVRRALRESHATNEPAVRVAWARTAVDIQAKMVDTYVEAGIIDKRIVQELTVKPDEGKVIERIPSGQEVRAWFQKVGVVKDEELISDAQRAYMYGDEAVDGEVVE